MNNQMEKSYNSLKYDSVHKWLIQVCQLMFFVFFLGGCSKTDDHERLEKLKGTWINTQINDVDVVTNNRFIMEFADEAEYYSVGVVFDSVNKKWIDRKKYDYSLLDDRLFISGSDVKENKIELEFGIVLISNSELVCRVNLFKMNGSVVPDSKMYRFKRDTEKLNEEITGTWYGQATYAGSTDTDYHYWNYRTDGTYEYYFRENPGSSKWIRKTDNEGRYYLYDNYLATNWSNDMFSGVKGLDYECWEIEISGDVMKWTGYRENGKVTSYEMKKVSGPPDL